MDELLTQAHIYIYKLYHRLTKLFLNICFRPVALLCVPSRLIGRYKSSIYLVPPTSIGNPESSLNNTKEGVDGAQSVIPGVEIVEVEHG